jgi:alpha-1,2-mannosyltransferase
VLGCLISPVSWIHHCVWLLPAIILCVAAVDRRLVVLGVSAYTVMTSRLTWLWETRPRPPLELFGANFYFWFSLALLIWTPVGVRRSLPENEEEKIAL